MALKLVLHAIEGDKPVCPHCHKPAIIPALTTQGDGFLCDYCSYFIPRHCVVIDVQGPEPKVIDGKDY